MLTASNNLGAYTWTYTSDGQVATQTDLWGIVLTDGYDGNGNPTTVQDNHGGQLSSVYDADNRLTSRTLSASGTAVREDWTYTNDSQMATAKRYSGTSTANLISQSAFTYDVRDNLTNEQHQNISGATLEQYVYSYDLSDRLTSETATNSAGTNTTTNYTYDASNQLLTAGSKTFTWDANGNQTSNGFVAGANNQVTTDGTWNYSYDAEGNLIEKVKVATGETWTYSYDNANHLVSATDKGSGGAVISQVTEKYDVLGQRVEEDTTTAGTTTVQRFSYDTDGNVWADLDGNNTIQMRRMYDDAGGLLARISASGTVGWYLTDHLSSVRAITNGSGAVIDEASYDAFGNVVSETNAAYGDRFKYAGYAFQVTMGMYFTENRVYDPVSGRWLQQDQSGFDAGDGNLYRYVGNEPTDSTDPIGLASHPLSRAKDRNAITSGQWRALVLSPGVLRGPELDGNIENLPFERYFERAVIRLLGLQPYRRPPLAGPRRFSGVRYDSSERASKPNGRSPVRPDAIGSILSKPPRVLDPLAPAARMPEPIKLYTGSIFYDAKLATGNIYASSYNYEAVGYADVLGNKSSASRDKVLPLMVYITTSDTKLDTALVSEFTNHNVLVGQAYMAYDPTTKKLYLTKTTILNARLMAGKAADKRPSDAQLSPPQKWNR